MNRFCCLVACFMILSASAQEKLVVMGKAPDRYVVHTADGKETLQTISNQFGQSVTKLAAYNHINASAALSKGDGVKIPLSKDIIVQQKNDNSAPLYHAIQKGDNLYRLSLSYNKVPIARLKEWNNMKNDIVKDGQLLIIGFMVNAPVKIPDVKKTEPVQELKPEEKVSVVPAKKIPKKRDSVIITPLVKATVPTPNPDKVTEPSKLLTMQTGDFYEFEKAQKIKDDAKAKAALIAPEMKPSAEIKKSEKTPINKTEEKIEYIPKEGDEGCFASAYADHPKEQAQQFHSGDAATFKTISGWTDRKFYVLMNDIAPRTIVRITGPSNKSICAMVLGPLQETKGATGLLLRISNSAASALGIADPKFTVTVTYFE